MTMRQDEECHPFPSDERTPAGLKHHGGNTQKYRVEGSILKLLGLLFKHGRRRDDLKVGQEQELKWYSFIILLFSASVKYLVNARH